MLKDHSFKEAYAYEKHVNPEAVLSTTLKTYSVYSLQDCYSKKNFFWSFAPEQNDSISFKFNKPFHLKKYIFYKLSKLK